MRSVNIADDLLEIESASEESLEAFELNDCWTQIHDSTHMSKMTRRASVAMTQTQNTQTVHLVAVSQKKRCTGPCVQIWAGVFLSVILLDVVRWPLIAFEGKYALATDLSITTFAFLSIPLSATIAWSATDTWRRVLLFALLEVLLITTQCVDVLLGANSAFLRSVQLLRLLQLPRYLHLTLVHTSREMRAVLNLLLAGLMLCLFLHMLTCLWFFVGQHGGWVDSETDLMDFQAKYMTSLEWALSRIPPSRMSENMLLHRQSERVVALLATGLTILFGSIFTSIVTNDISDVRRVRRLQREAEYQVFDFLAAFPVPWELELQLKEYLQRNRSTIQLPRKQDMASLLPEYLFNELCREAMAPIIANHSFLQSLGMRFAAFQHDLCLKGFTDWNVSNQEILFSPGPKCENMLFVAYGTVGYMCKAGISSGGFAVQPVPSAVSRKTRACTSTLYRGDSLCEACIWTAWHYLGTATADSQSALLCLSLESLKSIVSVHKEAASELVVYARVFVNKLNDVDEDKDLTDLHMHVDYNRQLFRSKGP